MNDETNSEAQSEAEGFETGELGAEETANSSHVENQAEADRAAEGLREQIAALRQQVRDAQETLRDHQRKREIRNPKR
ncbi:hypothetical protein [Phenylobacterium soli]|uniref:Uncharacterized protein n=1 Tax=Phenylobacterium soli TaxID=2170551 RepID=A0A328ALQ0_9CAUL|nr:hypothetical protein [Phenylobacterium soli]RAK55883.1 hypothetical protein DJ017_15905 [Phenylobacterium soli]